LKNLGFEPRPFYAKTKLIIAGGENFVEAFLGLHKIEVTEWKAFETRFGIKLPLHEPNFSKGTIHVQPGPVDQCVIAVRESPLSPPVLFEGEMFIPAIRNLPRDQMKFLVKSKLFLFLMDHQKVRFTTDEAATQTASLEIKEWINFFKALVILCKGAGTITISPSRFSATSFPLKFRDNVDPAEYDYLARAFESAQTLLNLAGAVEPKVSLANIAERAGDIIGLERLFSGMTNKLPLMFKVKWPEGAPLPKKVDAIFAGYIPIADVKLVYYGITEMHSEREDEMTLWKPNTIEPREIVALNNFPDDYEKFIDRAKAKENIDNVMMVEVLDHRTSIAEG
jgi:hypothetical protein